MKILLVFLISVFLLNKNVRCDAGSNHIISNRNFTPDDVIHLLSELARNLIKTGDETNGIPILDPYEFQRRQLNLEVGEKFNVKINLTDGKFTGLGNYGLQQYNFSKSEISMNLNIVFPSLNLYSDYYELDGNVYDAIPLKGEGIADIEIQNLSLWGKVFLKRSAYGNSILIDKIEDPEFSIDRIVSKSQFDNNIDGILNAMVEDLLAGYLTRFNKYIAASYSHHVAPSLNPTLSNFENWDLLALLLYEEIEY